MKYLVFYIIIFVLFNFITPAHAKLNDNLTYKFNLTKESTEICKKIEDDIFKISYNSCIKTGYLKGILTIADCRLWSILDAKEEHDKCIITIR